MSVLSVQARIQGGAKGALAPPPQKIAPPNSQVRIQGGQEGLAPPGGQEGLGPPPYKILDPPMLCVAEIHNHYNALVVILTSCAKKLFAFEIRADSAI